MPGPVYTLDRKKLTAELTADLRKAGIIVPDACKDVVVSFVLARLGAQRERMASIVDSLANNYDSLSVSQMDTLSRLIREHRFDADGNITLQDD